MCRCAGVTGCVDACCVYLVDASQRQTRGQAITHCPQGLPTCQPPPRPGPPFPAASARAGNPPTYRRSSCRGDSGSPLILPGQQPGQNDTVVGLTSYGHFCELVYKGVDKAGKPGRQAPLSGATGVRCSFCVPLASIGRAKTTRQEGTRPTAPKDGPHHAGNTCGRMAHHA